MSMGAAGFRLASAILGLVLFSSVTAADPPGRLTLSVQETAGIRRFNYPVSAVLPLPDAAKGGMKFRLLEKGKAIPAQFSVQGDAVLLDFNVGHAPLESREYVVEYGSE